MTVGRAAVGRAAVRGAGRFVRERDLAARARERDGVRVLLGSRRLGAEPVDLQLAVTGGRWTGLGRGHGRLVARQVDVVARGRGAAARERRARLWLPGPGGEVALADEPSRPSHRRPSNSDHTVRTGHAAMG